MRDHSEQELRRKLAAPVMGKNGPEALDVTPEEVDRVVAWCIENRYLDDQRFVRQFIASRSRKGYGPARIRQELNQKGIAREEGERAMRECEIDWALLAKEQAQRKYGDPLPTVFAEKSQNTALFAVPRLLNGRYPGNLAKFCRLTHRGFYFPVKKTYLIPTLFRPAAGCLKGNQRPGRLFLIHKIIHAASRQQRSESLRRTKVRS
nr:Regulatory protein RecX [Raoultella sp. NCTC 9187]